MLGDEGFVPFSSFDEYSAVSSHLVLVLSRLGIGEVGLQSVEPRNDFLNDGDVFLQLLRFVDNVDENVHRTVE
jgi:hypothetical protein